MQPRKPKTISGRSSRSRPSIPILPIAFCSAMSRTEQVLSSTTSASVSLPRHLVAARHEHLRDLLGVALVHLASVGFDEDLGHGSAHPSTAFAGI